MRSTWLPRQKTRPHPGQARNRSQRASDPSIASQANVRGSMRRFYAGGPTVETRLLTDALVVLASPWMRFTPHNCGRFS